MLTALIVFSSLWLAIGLLLRVAVLWKTRYPGTDSAASLNSFGAMAGMMIAVHLLYGIPLMILLWSAYGIWRWLS